MAALTFKVGGDTTGLGRALGGAKGMLNSFAGSVKRLAIGGAFAGVAASVGGVTAAIFGLKNALELGGRLSDVASNTGLLAGEALVLERALQDAGIAGEKLQPTIQKMQKSIVEAGDGLMTPKRAFEELGVSLAEIKAMKPGEQFATIQKALAGVSDPAERSARAMQIFGRSGGELGALFSNADAMGNAADSVGNQAEILNRSADAFDRSADLLGGIGAKLKGFFVGMADYINPVLLPVLEEMNKIDIAKHGQAVGEVVSMIVEAFRGDKIGGILKSSFLIAGKELVNFLVNSFLGLGRMLGEMFAGVPKVFQSLFDTLTDGTVWKGLGLILQGVGTEMGLAFVKAIPEILRPGFGDDTLAHAGRVAEAYQRVGGNILGESEALRGLGEAVSGTVDAMGDAFADQIANGVEALDTSGNRAELRAVIEGLRKSVEEKKKADEEEKKEEGKKSGILPKPAELAAGFAGVMKPVVSSMTRIGGGGVSRGILQMDRRRNDLLSKIEQNTREGAVARYA